MESFGDILNMQYPNMEIERDFPDKILRAAQFAPFAALTGYDEAVAETARRTEPRPELDECAKEELNRKLWMLKELPGDYESAITYFVPDERKSGGKCETKTGRIKKICEYERNVVFCDGTKIPLEDVLQVESELFCHMEN